MGMAQKGLDLNLLISQQHPNDLNISFNARTSTVEFFGGARTRIFTTKYNKFQHVYPLYFEHFFHPYTQTHVWSFTPVFGQDKCVFFLPFLFFLLYVCMYKVCQKVFLFFPGYNFHYFRVEVVRLRW